MLFLFCHPVTPSWSIINGEPSAYSTEEVNVSNPNVQDMLEVIPFLIHFLMVGIVHEAGGDAEGKCPYEQMQTGPSPPEGRRTPSTTTVCDLMKPRKGVDPEQTTACPWTIFIYKDEIEQRHAQPVTLGPRSTAQSEVFHGYLLTAKKLVGGQPGSILGHFEPQWDASGHCCGNTSHPNMLDGSLSARVRRTNQTVYWTAPDDYIGPFVFVATVWKTAKKYWFEIKSPVINVIHKKK